MGHSFKNSMLLFLLFFCFLKILGANKALERGRGKNGSGVASLCNRKPVLVGAEGSHETIAFTLNTIP